MIPHSLLALAGSEKQKRMGTDIPHDQRGEVEYTEHARDRMDSYNLTPDHVAYALANSKNSYPVKKNVVVYASTLPDGRNIKVRIQSDPKKRIVIDAFTHVQRRSSDAQDRHG